MIFLRSSHLQLDCIVLEPVVYAGVVQCCSALNQSCLRRGAARSWLVRPRDLIFPRRAVLGDRCDRLRRCLWTTLFVDDEVMLLRLYNQDRPLSSCLRLPWFVCVFVCVSPLSVFVLAALRFKQAGSPSMVSDILAFLSLVYLRGRVMGRGIY